jgi:hypothetical protein
MMKHVLGMLCLLVLFSCDSTNPEDYIVFADGSKFLKTEFREGMQKGCDAKSVTTVAHFDRQKYCDCMIEYVMNHSREIALKPKADDPGQVGVDLVSYFDTDAGAAQVSDCREGAIDESRFDWAAEEMRFKEAFPPRDTLSKTIEKHQAYLDCVWDRVREVFGPREMADPLFKDDPRLKAIVDSCAVQVDYVIPE